MLELLVQPGAGAKPLIEAIESAHKTIHIVIFRFDRGELEAALKRAARRGVQVHALVAFTTTGQGGEKMLRALEMRLLADGVSVSRTATDLVRYHDKLLIIDSKTLFMLGFNFTYIDMDRSRSFGIVTQKREWVQEAEKLFLADSTRQNYVPVCPTFLVSPGNSRQELISFVTGAEKQILIYDGKLTDLDMMRLLSEKAAQGVEVRLIGAIGRRAAGIVVAPCPMRLHAQAIIRDGVAMFLGSQSLRSLELDARREVGLIIEDAAVARRAMETFEADWAKSKSLPASAIAALPTLETETEAEPPALAAATPAVPPTVAVKEVIKEAIMDALLETLHDLPDTKEIKAAVKEGAKEALGAMADQLASTHG